MELVRWDHDGVSLTVPATRGALVVAVLPVCVSIGMITVAMAAALVTLWVPGVQSPLSTGLSYALILCSPAPLSLSSRWSAPISLVARYTGVRIGSRHYARDRILGVDHRSGVVHLLLDDGSIVRTPPIQAPVAQAIRDALHRPGDLFAASRSTRILAELRDSRLQCARTEVLSPP